VTKGDVDVLKELTRVRAHDVDIGRNGVVKYELASFVSDDVKSIFNVDPETGAIYFNKNFKLQNIQRNAWFDYLSFRFIKFYLELLKLLFYKGLYPCEPMIKVGL
jgi:hypothetical protein